MDASSREKLLEALKHSIPKKQIFENAPMSRYTTLRLGGPADVLVQIASVEQLSSAYAAAEVPVRRYASWGMAAICS